MSAEEQESLTHAAVVDAALRIADAVEQTPVLRSDVLDERCGVKLHFKCEHLQAIGAFKLRGASHALASLDMAQASAGVCTHSSGNHGAALALAARQRGIACTVVVPEGANAQKLANIQQYGARIVRCAPTQAAREQTLSEIQAQTGAIPIPPYDHPDIICGQGTAALELLQQQPDLEGLLVPVGGGGLLAGSLLAADGHCPVWGCEPAGADDTARSLAAGKRLTDLQPQTICDGLRAVVGRLNFSVIQQHGAQILTVDDEAVIEAMQLLWRHLKQTVEPSAAITLAAVLRHPEQFRGRRLGLILSGGNVDLEQLPWS